jgi:hypothetical protein
MMSLDYFQGVRPAQRAGSAGNFGALSSPFSTSGETLISHGAPRHHASIKTG